MVGVKERKAIEKEGPRVGYSCWPSGTVGGYSGSEVGATASSVFDGGVNGHVSVVICNGEKPLNGKCTIGVDC